MMTGEQVGGIVRTILAAVGGWAAGKGYVDNETAITIAGALATVAAAAWSFATKKKTAA